MLVVAFGTTVAMWAAGYVCRLPSVLAPAPLLMVLLLACPVAGGLVLGQTTSRGVRGGFQTGLLSGLLNLLVLGGLVSGSRTNQVIPSAFLWIPGSILLSTLLAMAGAAIGARRTASHRRAPEWISAFAWVAAAATLLLLAVGGLVTSQQAGLSVADWPNSFGYAMFLYPLSRMTGGIYYEHAHRLFGSLVGLTTLVLAVQIHRVDARPRVRGLALAALVLVIVQGILGGLRVTGRFTLSTSPQDTSPSLTLAVVHGVLGQVFLGIMVALAVVTTRAWRERAWAVARTGARREVTRGLFILALLLLQIVLGAVQRHLAAGLLLHILLASLVAPLAMSYGMRAWGLHGHEPILGRSGIALAIVTGLQVLLGVGAWAVGNASASGTLSPEWEVTVTTAHQSCGALMLACLVSVVLWSHRLVGLIRAPAGGRASTSVVPAGP